MKSIHIAGGDDRQIFLGEMLRTRGYHISMQGFEKAGISSSFDEADIVYLPVPYNTTEGFIKAPYSENKITIGNVVSKYKDSFFVLGKCDEKAKLLLGERYFDLLRDESFLVDNAALTAEGAILAYQRCTRKSLINKKCVVVGYGRIGKLLCSMLQGYSCSVTATARKEKDLALIRAAHLNCERTRNLQKAVKDADVIFNTVPYHVFGEKELEAIKKDAVFIELASAPYGCDMEVAKKIGVQVQFESGIPGRYFPKSAATAMMKVFEREEYKWI